MDSRFNNYLMLASCVPLLAASVVNIWYPLPPNVLVAAFAVTAFVVYSVNLSEHMYNSGWVDGRRHLHDYIRQQIGIWQASRDANAAEAKDEEVGVS